jgi:hypothetical protein
MGRKGSVLCVEFLHRFFKSVTASRAAGAFLDLLGGASFSIFPYVECFIWLEARSLLLGYRILCQGS